MKKLETWPPRSHHGRRDWGELFNGEVWDLTAMVDFTTVLNFRPEVYKRAKAAGILVKTTVKWEDGVEHLIVQGLGPREEAQGGTEEGSQLEEDSLPDLEAGG